MHPALLAIAALAALAGGVLAESGTKAPYRQSPAVLANFPDLPVTLSLIHI